MNTDFSIDELKNMHLSLITRERVIREQWIPVTTEAAEVQRLMVEADELKVLQAKVCSAQLSKELGFYIPPVAA